MRLWLLFLSLLLAFARTATAESDYALDPARVAHAPITYRSPGTLSAFPTPVLSIRRGGLAAGAAELAEIKEKIIYPVIIRSEAPISAIVVEWLPALPEGLSVSVIWANGKEHGAMLHRAPGGHYEDKAYEVFFAKPTP